MVIKMTTKKIPKMFCRKCGVELNVKDRSNDEKHMKLVKGMAEMGIPMSPYFYWHPKDKGCALKEKKK